MISKTGIMRGGEYKCRIIKTCLKVRDQQLRTIIYLYRLLFKKLIVTMNYNIYTNKREKGIQT